MFRVCVFSLWIGLTASTFGDGRIERIETLAGQVAYVAPPGGEGDGRADQAGFLTDGWLLTVFEDPPPVDSSLSYRIDDASRSEASVRAFDRDSGLTIATVDTSHEALSKSDRDVTWSDRVTVVGPWMPDEPIVIGGRAATREATGGAGGRRGFKVDATLTATMVGAPVFDDGFSLVGVVHSPLVAGGAGLPSLWSVLDVDEVQKLIEFTDNGGRGALPRAWLGVAYQWADGRLRVVDVVDGTPADDSGLKDGDTILSIWGQVVDRKDALADAIADADIGDLLKLEIIRDEQVLTPEIVLAVKPESSDDPPEVTVSTSPVFRWVDGDLQPIPGVEVPLSDEIRKQIESAINLPMLFNADKRLIPVPPALPIVSSIQAVPPDVNRRLDTLTEAIERLTEKMELLGEPSASNR